MKTVITSEAPSLQEYLTKVWKHRHFVVVLAKRDLKIKYAQTFLGVAWSIVQPLVAVVVFTLFFGVLLNLETPYPYVLFVLSGVVCWNFFNYIFSHGSTSLMNNQDLIRKLSFPKIILPISKVLVALVEFGFTLLLLIPMFIYHHSYISWNGVFFPVVIFFILIFSLGLSLILAASTLRFRDLHHIIPFLVNFGIWFTPVFYPVSLIPDQFKDLIYINPMACLIGLARWSLFGESISYMALFGVLISVMFLLIGVIYFKRVEDRISETV
ncbi:MAG: lipopolysaccharide transport system permease protein [Bacteroidia bacterium]|jgi:lipopolysaccharide transport system permease protein